MKREKLGRVNVGRGGVVSRVSAAVGSAGSDSSVSSDSDSSV